MLNYTFAIRSDDFESLTLSIGDYYMSMTKKGNVFKEENVYIHADSLSISNGENTFFIIMELEMKLIILIINIIMAM